MRKLLNTLYVTTESSYLSLEGECAVIHDGEQLLGKIPLHNLEGIMYFGYKGASPALMGKCAEMGINLSFLSRHGRLLASIEGPTKGNVYLRETQILMASESMAVLPIAKNFLLAKLYNSKWVLARAIRDHELRVNKEKLGSSIEIIEACMDKIQLSQNVGELMGYEGTAAKAYFDGFNELILRNKETFYMSDRNRRPPLDPINAMLSLCYTILGTEIASALNSVGLDPYVGFLHQTRAGRKSLSLDLLEELRAPLADRFVLSLINLGMVSQDDFITKENGAVFLTDDSRKRFFGEWQKRKQEEIMHPFLQAKIPWGLVPYTQAMLLSRFLRGDINAYPPFFWK